MTVTDFCREGVKNPYRMQGKGLRSHLSRQTGRLRHANFSLFPPVFSDIPLFPAGKSTADCVSIQTITTSSPDVRDGTLFSTPLRGIRSRNEAIILDGFERNPVFHPAAQTEWQPAQPFCRNDETKGVSFFFKK
jgi:hypothetical protein